MLESVLQRKIQKYLKDNLPNAVVWKNHGNQYSVIGLPDIMCEKEGKIVCIEVKVPGNTPTKLQEITLKKLKEAGAITGIAYSIEDVQKILENNKLLRRNENENK